MEIDEVLAKWEMEEKTVRARLLAPGIPAQ